MLDELGLSEIRVRDALLRASSEEIYLISLYKLVAKHGKENTALTNEASQRYSTTESQIKILKKGIVDIPRDRSLQLLPIVKDGLIVVKDLIQKFNELSPATKEKYNKVCSL